MRLSLSNFCYSFFLCLFGLSFAFVLVAAMSGLVYEYSLFLLVCACAITGSAVFLFHRLFSAKEAFFVRQYNKILCLFAALLLFVNIGAGHLFRYDPIFDLEAVYQGAIRWVETGSFSDYHSPTCYDHYFYIFPNNLGTLSLLALLFRVVRFFGVSDYFMTATVFNSLLAVCTMCLTSLCCKRLAGVRAGLFALIFFLFSPAFWIIGPVFYTDALSMLFPVLAFWIFLRSREEQAPRRRMLSYLLIGIVLALGFLIKATVLIAGIAILLWMILNKEWKNLLALGAILLACVFLLQLGFQQYIYTTQLDRETAGEKNTPVTFWLNLGFSETGRYNHADFQLSWKTEDPAERREVLSAALSEKLENLGFSGVCTLFGKKAVTAFGNGTLALSDFLDDRPLNNTALHEWVTYKGECYTLYSSVCTGVFLTTLLLMLCTIGWRGKRSPIWAVQIAVFGILFFLLFWEVNNRYVTNFVPLIFLCAAVGANRLCEEGWMLWKRRPAKHRQAE